jgi:hypothetical protein
MQPIGRENKELVEEIFTEYNEKMDLAKKLLLKATELINESRNLVSPCQTGLKIKFLSDTVDFQRSSELSEIEQKLVEIASKLSSLRQSPL